MRHYPLIFIIALFLGCLANAKETAIKQKVRYGYIKSSPVNVRKGPGEEYKVTWKFTKKGTPVELIYLIDNWYFIKDIDGSSGWIKSSLISKNMQHVLVIEYYAPLCRLPGKVDDCHQIGMLSKNLVLKVKSCNETWCRVIVKKNLTGWVPKKYLWGI